MISNKELLKVLDDAIIGPDGAVNDDAFMVFFNAFAEDLANINEPEDEDERDAFHDSTLKHQAFDFAPSNIERNIPPWNQGNYDLPSHLVYFVEVMGGDDEVKEAVLNVAKEAKEAQKEAEKFQEKLKDLKENPPEDDKDDDLLKALEKVSK